MPGYTATPTEQVKESFYCPHCKLLLRNAVQNQDGDRLCQEFCEDIRRMPDSQCADCGMSIPENAQVYPDKAARRETSNLEVHCPHMNTGCKWTGPLHSVEEHTVQCSHKGVQCPNDGCEVVTTAKLLEPHLNECSFREVRCRHCKTPLPFNQLAGDEYSQSRKCEKDATHPTDKLPTLPELLRYKIHQRVGVHYKIFGTLLLDDTVGSYVDSIELTCRGKPELIMMNILQEWVRGRGVALNWGTLIKTLRECELNTMADNIQATQLVFAA